MTHMGGPFSDFYCCGAWTLKIHEIRLISSTYSCSRETANIISPYSLSLRNDRVDKRIQITFENKGSILIPDGHTLWVLNAFSFPSRYSKYISILSADGRNSLQCKISRMLSKLSYRALEKKWIPFSFHVFTTGFFIALHG